MAKLEIEFPDGSKARVINALGRKFGYQAKIADPQNAGQMIDNPVGQAKFVKKTIAGMIKGMVCDQEEIEASSKARDLQRENSLKEIDVS